MEVTHALSVGAGTGAKVAEWLEGTGMPVSSLSASFSGSVAPTHHMQIGTRSDVRPNSEKSSPPVTGGIGFTRLAPNHPVKVPERRRVRARSLLRTETDSGVRVTTGRRSLGTPAAWAVPAQMRRTESIKWAITFSS